MTITMSVPKGSAMTERERSEHGFGLGRPRQTNCQNEPSYPGAETVAMSLRHPDLTCHTPRTRCSIQEPHRIDECGEFEIAKLAALRAAGVEVEDDAENDKE